jgi:carbonic anhydrase/acetyltransferase-like protein (isoleucine patch superfamily)
MGVPCKVRRQVTPEEQKRFAENAKHYVIYRKIYREEPS